MEVINPKSYAFKDQPELGAYIYDDGKGIVYYKGSKVCDVDINDCTINFDNSCHRLLSWNDTYDERIRKALELAEKFVCGDFSIDALNAAAAVVDASFIKYIKPFEKSDIPSIKFRDSEICDHISIPLTIKPKGIIQLYMSSGLEAKTGLSINDIITTRSDSYFFKVKIDVNLDIYFDDTAKLNLRISSLPWDLGVMGDRKIISEDVLLSDETQQKLVERVKKYIGPDIENYAAEILSDIVLKDRGFRASKRDKNDLSDKIMPIGVKSVCKCYDKKAVKAKLLLSLNSFVHSSYRSKAYYNNFGNNRLDYKFTDVVVTITPDDVEACLTGGLLKRSFPLPLREDEKKFIKYVVEAELDKSIDEYLDEPNNDLTSNVFDNYRFVEGILPEFTKTDVEVPYPCDGKRNPCAVTTLSLDSECMFGLFRSLNLEEITGLDYVSFIKAMVGYNEKTGYISRADINSRANMKVNLVSYYLDNSATIFVKIKHPEKSDTKKDDTVIEIPISALSQCKLNGLLEDYLGTDLEDYIAKELAKKYINLYPKCRYHYRSDSIEPSGIKELFVNATDNSVKAKLKLSTDNLRLAMFRSNAEGEFDSSSYLDFKKAKHQLDLEVTIRSDGSVRAFLVSDELDAPLPVPLLKQERDIVRDFILEHKNSNEREKFSEKKKSKKNDDVKKRL